MSYHEPGKPPSTCPPHRMKIECVTVCVNYSDFLAWFLLANGKMFDRLVVVTDTRDRRTADLCEHHFVECIKTDAFYESDKAFNKGAGINVALERLALDDWVLHVDADIVLPPRTPQLLAAADLDPSMIYGVDRMLCRSFDDWIGYASYPEVQHSCNAYIQATAFPLATRVGVLGEQGEGYVPIGFFQLWNPGVSGVRSYPMHGHAGRGDFQFGRLWPRAKRALLPEIVAVHLESEEAAMAANWRGRRTVPFGPDHKSRAPLRPAS